MDDRLRVALLRKRCLRKLAFALKFELHCVYVGRQSEHPALVVTGISFLFNLPKVVSKKYIVDAVLQQWDQHAAAMSRPYKKRMVEDDDDSDDDVAPAKASSSKRRKVDDEDDDDEVSHRPIMRGHPCWCQRPASCAGGPGERR